MTYSRAAASLLIAAALPLSLASSPAAAEAASSAASPSTGPGDAVAKGAAKPGARTKYCFIEEHTGSHIVRQSCRTKAEWEAIGIEIPARFERK